MRGLVVGALLSIGLATSAQAVPVVFTEATGGCGPLNPGNNVNCQGSTEGTATITFGSAVPGGSTITVTGQTNQNSAFDVFAFNANTSTLIANDVNFGNGFNPITFTLPDGTFTGLRFETERLGNSANFQGNLRSEANLTAVPGPIAGAGLPVLMALGGFVWARRRKAAATA
jgi:hypothetical protein